MPKTNIYLFSCTKKPQEVYLTPGIYLFEAWGAAGHDSQCLPDNEPHQVRGRGAYTSGVLQLKFPKTFYVYVGEKNYQFNYISVQGGGATDFRLQKSDDWSDFDSLKSRIMVAAGGGGGDCNSGGDGGALEGFPGTGSVIPSGGNQTSPGTAAGIAYDGDFGIGGSGTCRTSNESCDGAGSGGGGYYGGGGKSGTGGGAGGSSFVSGYIGCNAISKESTKNNIIHTENSIHYSNIFFHSPRMIAGNELMPSYINSNEQMTGNLDAGFAKITVLAHYLTSRYTYLSHHSHIVLYILLNFS